MIRLVALQTLHSVNSQRAVPVTIGIYFTGEKTPPPDSNSAPDKYCMTVPHYNSIKHTPGRRLNMLMRHVTHEVVLHKHQRVLPLHAWCQT